MSGQLVGQAIGYYFGGPIGGMIGGMIGGLLDPAKAPSLGDLAPQASEYGRPLSLVYGSTTPPTTVIWADEFRVESEGGKGAESPTGATAYANFAVAICEGHANLQLGRIWAGPERRLIWDGLEVEGGATLTFYNGAEDQMPSPLIEAAEGAGNVPAFRGTAYITLENFNCLKDGNRLPFLTIEVGIIEGNLAPADLGTFVPIQAITTEDYYAVIYHGSYNGIIVRRLSDYRLVKHYTYSDPEWDVGSPFFWDEDRGLFIRPNVDTMTYSVLNIETGDLDTHTLTAAVGAEPNPGQNLRGGVYHNGYYVFIADPDAAGQRTTLYLVDPATLLTVFTYTSDLNGDVQRVLMKPLDSAPWVYGVTAAGTIQKYAMAAATAPVSVGAAATGMAEGHIAVDPATGYIWSAAASGTTLTVHVNDPITTNSLIHSDVVAWSASFSQGMPITFVDGANGPYVLIHGEQFFATDAYMMFSSTTFAVLGSAAETYHGTSELALVIHDPVTDLLIGIREGGTVNYAYNTDPVGLRMLSPAAGGGELFIPWQGPPLPASYIGTADGSLAPEGQPLSEVVLDLSLRAGLTADQVDVTALEDDIVDGYAVASQTTVRDAVTALMPAFYFDMIESEGVVKAVKRGGAVTRVIPDEDVGCFEAGSEPVDPIETTRRMENELPRTLTVRYLLAANDYATAARSAKRLVGASGEEKTLDFPFVMTDTKAQQVAEVNLHGAWVARISYSFTLPRKHADLEPTDVITVYGYTMRLTKTIQVNGIIKCEAEADIASTWTPKVVVKETVAGEGSGGSGGGGGVITPSVTILELA
jgi:hypothetical protein